MYSTPFLLILSVSGAVMLAVAFLILYKCLGSLAVLRRRLQGEEVKEKELLANIKSLEQERNLLVRKIEEQSKEIGQKDFELNRLYEAAISRELKMAELKNKILELRR